MHRVRIILVTDFGPNQTIEATRTPPLEFQIRTECIVPFMQALERLTKTPDLLVTSILAMDNAVTLTRQPLEHP